MASDPITSWGKNGNSDRFYFLGFQNLCSHETKRCSLEGKLWQTKTVYYKVDISFANKGLNSQSYSFSSSHVWIWQLDCEESWALKNWCFWTVVLEKTLESPLDCKEIQPVLSKINQSWIFIGRTDAEAETPILATWCKKPTHWKRPWCWKSWRQKVKGTTEDKMVGWHHPLNGNEFE